MQLRNLLAVGAMVVSASLTFAQNNDLDLQRKINEAVIQVYTDELSKNPNDYGTLHARANQYFVAGDFLRALDDVNRAIEITPNNEAELRYDEYMLRAKIHGFRDNLEEQRKDLEKARELSPQSVNALGLLANVNLELKDLGAAQLNFERILRIDPVNYDAMAGLARVHAARGENGKAAEWADKAVGLYPANPRVYINRAEVLISLLQYEAAAQDYISAISVGDDSGESLGMLVEMSHYYYKDVRGALSNSVDKTGDKGEFRYIRAVIAMAHNHFTDALTDFNFLVDNQIYDYYGIYADLAECYYNLGDYAPALTNINKAVRALPEESKLYVTQSKILRETGLYDDAIAALNNALMQDAEYMPALSEKARVYYDMGNYQKAVETLNTAIVTDPEVMENLLLRGFIYKDKLDMQNLANADFQTMLGAEDNNNSSLRGFALVGLGKKTEALEWANKVVQRTYIEGGESYYLATCIAAQCGDTNKAMSYLGSALANGYENIHNLRTSTEPAINIAPIRNEARFTTVLNQMLGK